MLAERLRLLSYLRSDRIELVSLGFLALAGRVGGVVELAGWWLWCGRVGCVGPVAGWRIDFMRSLRDPARRLGHRFVYEGDFGRGLAVELQCGIQPEVAELQHGLQAVQLRVEAASVGRRSGVVEYRLV